MSLDELLGTAKALVDGGFTPSCQLAVARDGDLIAFETFGAATNGNRFCCFSATKPIVASLMWLLIADGSVDVLRPVADYVDEFGANGLDAVTVEQVMLHTAGFPNAVMNALEGADPERRRKRFSTWTLEWEPGTRFEYHAGAAHWVLADIIERVTGDDFRDALERRVCAPLGLPRLLGIAPAEQGDVVDDTPCGDPAAGELVELLRYNEPDVRAAGAPGGGGILTAATMARFYQALLHDPGGVWDTAVLDDAKTNVRCRFEDPLMHVSANRTLGLVLAGDDGLHQFRYGMLGAGNSPGTFGHSGAACQVAWADPDTGISF
ncbi:MAG TPA: serine hydrolase domain-containing protein, partial [Acidimicrobiia bacterium]